MRIYRIADRRHPIWDGSGAALVGGRWNSPGHPAIYASLSYACAMLEMLAHAGIGRIPDTQACVSIEIPDEEGLIERHEAASLPRGWDSEDSSAARAFGDQWLQSLRSLVLVVPSVVARLEFNAVVNPAHRAFASCRATAPEPVIWDRRLFSRV